MRIIIATILIMLVLLLAAEWAVTRARWGVITTNFRLFLVWIYPLEEAWRVLVALSLLSLIASITAARSRRSRPAGAASGMCAA